MKTETQIRYLIIKLDNARFEPQKINRLNIAEKLIFSWHAPDWISDVFITNVYKYNSLVTGELYNKGLSREIKKSSQTSFLKVLKKLVK